VVEPGHDTAGSTSALGQLSSRELEVLEMTSAGCTNSEIARRLDVTVHAVKFHLGSVYRKLGVDNRTEAAVAFLRGNGAGSIREET
jgi:DNA-binding CsgD family transcriptional regulator